MFEHEHVFWAKYDLSTLESFSDFHVHGRSGRLHFRNWIQNAVGGSHPSTSRPFPRHPPQIESVIFLILDPNVGHFRDRAMASFSRASSWARIESIYSRSDGCIDRSTLSRGLVGRD